MPPTTPEPPIHAPLAQGADARVCPLDWPWSPLDVWSAWPECHAAAGNPHAAALPPAIALLSGQHGGPTHAQARFSILAPHPFDETDDDADAATVHTCPATASSETAKQALKTWAAQAEADPTRLWIGHVGYDLGRSQEPVPTTVPDDRHWPLFHFQALDRWLVFDHAENQWFAAGTWAAAGRVPGNATATSDDADASTDAAQSGLTLAGLEAALRERLGDAASPHASPAESRSPLRVVAEPAATAADWFPARVQTAKDLIAQGDIFQVNLAHRLTWTVAGKPGALLNAWHAAAPGWYSACVPWLDHTQAACSIAAAPTARVLVSGSPELFLEKHGPHVRTRPIKGTLPAERPAAELLASEKDAAELHMIVDLMRNDLGRVCQPGTVKVPEPRSIETHPTVHHGVATVTGQLRRGQTLADLLLATLPGGSITGAPKVRAMQIIESLETTRRGPYCGCIGWVLGDQAVFNIAIRTACLSPACVETEPVGVPVRDEPVWHLDHGVGGGIVADSEPDLEYAETLTKSQAIRRALAACRL